MIVDEMITVRTVTDGAAGAGRQFSLLIKCVELEEREEPAEQKILLLAQSCAIVSSTNSKHKRQIQITPVDNLGEQHTQREAIPTEADGLHMQHNGFVFDEKAMLQATSTFEEAIGNGFVTKYCLSWFDEAPGCLRRDVALIFQTQVCSEVAIVCIEERRQRETDDEVEYYATIIGHGEVKVQERPAEGQVIRGVLTGSDQKWCLT